MIHGLSPQTSLSEKTLLAGREWLTGKRRNFSTLLSFLGPAVIASVAYMDPGNFATNIQAGAQYHYNLLWVVLLANIIAMLFQSLSAKIGIVTGQNLPEVCRDEFPRNVVWVMWGVSEIAAMATDLAEFLGAAVGFALLFNISILYGMVITGVITYGILLLDRKGFRPIELLIGALVAVIGISYLIELFIVPPDWKQAALHSVLPQLDGMGAVTLAVGIIGATVMPHAIYLHSALTQSRIVPENDDERRQLIRLSNLEVMVALGFAGLVNMVMVMMAAASFFGDHGNVGSIEDAYQTLRPLFGAAAAGIFLTSLIASGLSSSAVGTMAGQMIMQGFVRFHIPIWLRRVLTMIPAFIVVAMGINATQALVWSQVVLSLVLPVPMIALLILTQRKSVMGIFANSRAMTVMTCIAAVVILILNALLIVQLFSPVF